MTSAYEIGALFLLAALLMFGALNGFVPRFFRDGKSLPILFGLTVLGFAAYLGLRASPWNVPPARVSSPRTPAAPVTQLPKLTPKSRVVKAQPEEHWKTIIVEERVPPADPREASPLEPAPAPPKPLTEPAPLPPSITAGQQANAPANQVSDVTKSVSTPPEVSGSSGDSGKWQDATLVTFRTVQAGSVCSSSGSVNGTVDDSGRVTGSTESTSDCAPRTVRYYTVAIGEHTYVLRPELTGAQKATVLATLGYGALFMKKSVLANQLPGARISVRSDKKGFWVKAGNRQSKYEVVEAH